MLLMWFMMSVQLFIIIIIGNHDEAIGYWVDTATDVAALIIPGVPAGVTKVAKATDKIVET